VTTKTVRHDGKRIAFDPGKILAKRLPDLETDKGLITAEPECGRDFFKVLKTSSGIRLCSFEPSRPARTQSRLQPAASSSSAKITYMSLKRLAKDAQ
jgi:hypothetical protein